MLGRLLRSYYTDTQAAADSSQWSKTFDSRGIGTEYMHCGEISPPGLANTLAPYERSADSHAPSVVHQMYEYLRPEYAKYFLDGTAEVITRDDGYIELRSAPTNASGSIYMYTLDPNKGYAPVSTAQFVPDKTGDTGTYSVQCTFSEHVEIQGIWIPMLSRTIFEGNGRRDKSIVTVTVTDFQLNVDFRPEDLDISFPDGTVVTDHIAGQNYTVGQTTAGEQQDAAEMIPKAVANNNDQIAVGVKPETIRSSEPLVGNAKATIEQQTGALRLAWLALALGIVFSLALVFIAAFVVRRRLLHKQISGAHRAYQRQAPNTHVTTSHPE